MIKGTVRGKIKAEVVHPDGRIEYPFGDKFFPNLVLDVGLDMLFNGAPPANANTDYSFLAVMAYARVGSDNTAVNAAQSLLGNQLNSTGNYFSGTGANTVTYDTGAGSATFRRTFEFPPEVANTNYNEVGFSNVPSAGDLFSRALFPGTVTVLLGSNLRLTYELELTIPQIVTATSVSVSDGGFDGEGDLKVVGTLANIFGGINTNGLPGSPGISAFIRGRIPFGSPATNAFAYLLTNSAFPSVDANLVPVFSGTDAADSTSDAATGAYTLSNYYRDYTFTFPIGTPASTVNNIRSITFGGTNAGIQWLLDAAQEKLSANALAPVFRVAWGRP